MASGDSRSDGEPYSQIVCFRGEERLEGIFLHLWMKRGAVYNVNSHVRIVVIASEIYRLGVIRGVSGVLQQYQQGLAHQHPISENRPLEIATIQTEPTRNIITYRGLDVVEDLPDTYTDLDRPDGPGKHLQIRENGFDSTGTLEDPEGQFSLFSG